MRIYICVFIYMRVYIRSLYMNIHRHIYAHTNLYMHTFEDVPMKMTLILSISYSGNPLFWKWDR